MILSLFLGLATANCIFDTNLQRPICLNTNGSRITWSEYITLPLEIKYQMQNNILIGISNGSFSVPNLNASEATSMLKMLNVSVAPPAAIVTIPTPPKKCQPDDILWAQYCKMMVSEGDWIDCDNAPAAARMLILSNMKQAQGCVP